MGQEGKPRAEKREESDELFKSPEQVEAERAQDWLMLQPAEALQFFGDLATPDELTAQILAIMTADDLQFRPKPIMRTVRFEHGARGERQGDQEWFLHQLEPRSFCKHELI